MRPLTRKSQPSFRVGDLLDSPTAALLQLALVAGKSGLTRPIRVPSIERPRAESGAAPDGRQPQPGGVLLIDAAESSRLTALPAVRRRRLLESWMSLPVAAVVTSGQKACPPELYAIARRRRVPILKTKLSSKDAVNRIGRLLQERLAARQIVHGVLMEVRGLGVLIIGESGIGKSESAVELIERGHRLVADDVVEIEYRDGTLVGRSPEVIRYYMELRGVGVVNIKELYGAGAIQLSTPLGLVIRLERWDESAEVERLGLEHRTHRLLGVDLPLVTMPVGPGRNLAMLIEVAARNQLMNARGRHAARHLATRVMRAARRRARPKSTDDG
ncbi:MAG: HPr(Ser) kinase/phosphatase [Vicinamibacteria bacterium]